MTTKKDSDVGILENEVKNIKEDVVNLGQKHTEFLERVTKTEQQNAVSYTQINGKIESISSHVENFGFDLKVVKEALVGDLKTKGLVGRLVSLEGVQDNKKKERGVIFGGLITLFCGILLLFITNHFNKPEISPAQIKTIVQQVQSSKAP